jgi:hypothetical protein
MPIKLSRGDQKFEVQMHFACRRTHAQSSVQSIIHAATWMHGGAFDLQMVVHECESRLH